jgi:hypothetical protein
MSSRGIGVTPAGAVAIAAAIVAYQLAGPSGSKWLTTLAVLVGLATFADGVVAFALMRRVELVVTPPSISQVGAGRPPAGAGFDPITGRHDHPAGRRRR